MCVQEYANPFIGEQIINIKKWEVRRNVYSVLYFQTCKVQIVILLLISKSICWLTTTIGPKLSDQGTY